MADTRNTILIVDNDPTGLRGLSEYLKNSGIQVPIATHAEAALEAISHVVPDIILLDVMMPGVDGFDLAARLKASEDSRDIPIIFVTALANAPDKVRGFEVGAVDYITKPIHVEEAAARINTHLTIHNLQKELEERNAQLVRINDELTREIAEHRQAEETLQRRNRDLVLLNQAGLVFNSTLDLEQVLVKVLETIRDLLQILDGSIWLLDEDTSELVCRYLSNPQSESIRGWRLPLGQGVVGWVAENGQSVLVPDTQEDSRYFEGVAQHIGIEIRSLIAVPLWDQQAVFGVLEVVDTVHQRFNEQDLRVIESLAATASIAIQNARLHEQAQRDAETKATLLHEVNHRVGNNLAAIMGLLGLERDRADVDHDTYRAVIKNVASRIQGLAAVHRMLSAADWSPLLLSELIERVIGSALQAIPLDKRVSVEVSSSPVRVTPKDANSLALVLNELTTNSAKYAWPARPTGHITVRIDHQDKVDATDRTPAGRQPRILIEFRDDGVGYPDEVLCQERYSVGWDLIQTIVCHGMQGEVSMHNDQGAVITIGFPVPAGQKWRVKENQTTHL